MSANVKEKSINPNRYREERRFTPPGREEESGGEMGLPRKWKQAYVSKGSTGDQEITKRKKKVIEKDRLHSLGE